MGRKCSTVKKKQISSFGNVTLNSLDDDAENTNAFLEFTDGTRLKFSRDVTICKRFSRWFCWSLSVIIVVACFFPVLLYHLSVRFREKHKAKPKLIEAGTNTELPESLCYTCGKLKKQLEEGRFNWKKAERELETANESVREAQKEVTVYKTQVDGIKEQVETKWKRRMEEVERRLEKANEEAKDQKEKQRAKEAKIKEQIEGGWRKKVEVLEKRLEKMVSDMEEQRVRKEQIKDPNIERIKKLNETIAELKRENSQLQQDAEKARNQHHNKVEVMGKKIGNVTLFCKQLQKEKDSEIYKLNAQLLLKDEVIESLNKKLSQQVPDRTDGLQDQLVFLTSIRSKMINEKPQVKAIEMTRKVVEWTSELEVEKESMIEMNRFCQQYENYMNVVEANILMIEKNLDFSTADLLDIPLFPEFSPSFLYAYQRALNSETMEHKECLICLEDMDSLQKFTKCNRCRRCYHVECTLQWLQKSTTCPVCKSTMRNPME